jgi:LysM repeat protein
MTYKVQAGETLYAISRKFGVTPEQIIAWNRLSGNAISIGQVLTVSAPSSTPTTPPPSNTTSSNTSKRYTVQKGDTLYSIATKNGVTVAQIQAWNKLTGTTLSLGQVLVVGTSSTPTPVTPKPIPSPAPTPIPTPVIPSTPASGLNQFVVTKTNKTTYNSIVISWGTGSATMRDHYPSAFLVNPFGVSYKGQAAFENHLDDFEDILPRSFYADVLQFVAQNEGNFDAVNSYDKAIFSFGFLQFTGAAASGSVLSRVLQRFKNTDPSGFAQYFGQYGMDVNNTIFSYTWYQGDNAYNEVANDLRLTGAFIASGSYRGMIRAQVAIALEEYLNKALADSTSVIILGQTVSLNRVIYSEAGTVLRVDLCVNRGLTGSLAILKKAIEQVANQSGIFVVSGLSMIDEQLVVKAVVNNEVDPNRRPRLNNILNGTFSFDKGIA